MTDASSTAGDRRSRILGGGGGAGRNVAVALVSTAIVFTALGLLVVNSSGWEEVRQKFLNGEEFRTWFPTCCRPSGSTSRSSWWPRS